MNESNELQAIIAADLAAAELEIHFARFRRCIREAFNLYLQYPPQARIDHDERAVGACMHAHIKNRTPEVFADVSGARVVDHNGLHLVVINDKFACHFKLVDQNGNASFHRSKQQDSFAQHSLALPNMARPPIALRVGFVLDDLRTRVERMLLIMPNGARTQWLVSVSMDDAAGGWEVVAEQRQLKLALKVVNKEEEQAGKKKSA